MWMNRPDTRQPRRASATPPRTVGAIHLAFAGLVSALSGLALLYGSSSGRLLWGLFELAGRYVSDVTLLARADTITFLATTVAPGLGVTLLLVGVGQLIAARRAFEGRSWRTCLLASGLGLANPLSVPLALIATVLLVRSRDGFSVDAAEPAG